MTTKALPTSWDRDGFPIQICTRCGGSGHYSFNQIDGTKCFGCSGGGWQIYNTKVVKAAHTALLKARHDAGRPMARELEVGDVIREVIGWGGPSNQSPVMGWLTIAAIVVRDDAPLHSSIVVTMTNGDSFTYGPSNLLTRRVAIDPAPFLAAVPAKLRRPAAAAVAAPVTEAPAYAESAGLLF